MLASQASSVTPFLVMKAPRAETPKAMDPTKFVHSASHSRDFGCTNPIDRVTATTPNTPLTRKAAEPAAAGPHTKCRRAGSRCAHNAAPVLTLKHRVPTNCVAAESHSARMVGVAHVRPADGRLSHNWMSAALVKNQAPTKHSRLVAPAPPSSANPGAVPIANSDEPIANNQHWLRSNSDFTVFPFALVGGLRNGSTLADRGEDFMTVSVEQRYRSLPRGEGRQGPAGFSVDSMAGLGNRVKRWRAALHVTVSALMVAVAALAVAPTAHAAAAVATLRVTSTWQTGFIASFTITNMSMAPLSDWRLDFDMPAGQSVIHTWNSSAAQSGTHWVITPANWNRVIAPGGTATGGMRGVLSGTYTAPSNCVLNGQLPCS